MPKSRSTRICCAGQEFVEHPQAQVDRLVDVDVADLGAVELGEAAEVLDDLGHAAEPLARRLDQPGQVLLEIGQVGLLLEPLDPGGQLGLGGAEVVQALLIAGDDLEQGGQLAVQDRHVVHRDRQRVVDLVRHARRQRAQRGQLLGVDQLALGLLQLLVHLAEPLVGGGELLGPPPQLLLRPGSGR